MRKQHLLKNAGTYMIKQKDTTHRCTITGRIFLHFGEIFLSMENFFYYHSHNFNFVNIFKYRQLNLNFTNKI